MLEKFIAGDFITIAGEMRRLPASNENTVKHHYARYTVMCRYLLILRERNHFHIQHLSILAEIVCSSNDDVFSMSAQIYFHFQQKH
jgi:hypothetical protein